jgi:hypothetical protein
MFSYESRLSSVVREFSVTSWTAARRVWPKLCSFHGTRYMTAATEDTSQDFSTRVKQVQPWSQMNPPDPSPHRPTAWP